MTKKFVVGVEGLSLDQEKAFRNFIQEDGSGFWHWIDGLWLIDSTNDKIGVSEIRDFIEDLDPKYNVLVLEVTPINWASRGPETKERKFSRWVRESWDEDDQTS